MLPRLEYSPVNRRESLLIHHPERRHDAQRVPRADPQRLAPDGLRPHRHQRVHNLRDAAETRITRLERLVIRLSSRRDHILIKAEPVNVRSAPNISLSVEQQLRALARHIRVARDVGKGRLREGREDLGRQGRAEFREKRVDDRLEGGECAGSPGGGEKGPAVSSGQSSRGGNERQE